ncbi:MAG: hypothetical protein ACLUVF_01185 [Adlercreutzia sp.]
MSENEKMPTEPELRLRRRSRPTSRLRCWRTSNDEGRSGNGKRDPRGN